MDLNLNKREFKDAVNLRCDWQISDVPNQGGANTAPDARLDIHARGFWSRRDRVPHSLTYGCATQMRNLTRTSPLSKYIASMKTRRKVYTQAELWR